MGRPTIVNITKAIAPERVKRLYVLIRKLYRGKQYYCPVCNKRLRRFDMIPMWWLETLDKYGFIHSVFTLETLNLFACNCPSCSASDRDRLCALYLKQTFANMDTTIKYKFVDFGPSAALSKAIRNYPFLKYRSADLLADNVDDKVDIMNMPIYEDNSVDMFLCSHVLEHVEDDRKATAELYRILKSGGWGIVMVPIVLTLRDVYEDASIKNEADRWKHFGEGSHRRIYSKQGFINRLEETGFKVNQFGIDYFGAEVFEKYGIHPRSVLYVVEK